MEPNLCQPTATKNSDDAVALGLVTEATSSSSSTPCDFGFAFNDSNFSDRLLRIEIVDYGDDEAKKKDESVVRVKTLHISSLILAAKSPFFYKLFSNEMRESDRRHVTLRINAFEEAALMELLNFMYRNSLSITTVPVVLDILMVADKFEVASCVKYCSRLLRDMPMTQESALLYLDLPSKILMAEAVVPLIGAAKEFLATRYRDVTKNQHEGVKLHSASTEAVQSSDDLLAASEDSAHDFTMKRTTPNYPKLEERGEILGTSLIHYICFPFLSCLKLKKVLMCYDFNHETA